MNLHLGRTFLQSSGSAYFHLGPQIQTKILLQKSKETHKKVETLVLNICLLSNTNVIAAGPICGETFSDNNGFEIFIRFHFFPGEQAKFVSHCDHFTSSVCFSGVPPPCNVKGRLTPPTQVSKQLWVIRVHLVWETVQPFFSWL